MKKSTLATKKSSKKSSIATDREIWALAAISAAELPGDHWKKNYPPKIFTSPERKAVYQSMVCGGRSLAEVSNEFFELKTYSDTIKMVYAAHAVILKGYSFYAAQAADIMLKEILRTRMKNHPLKPRKSRAKKGFTH